MFLCCISVGLCFGLSFELSQSLFGLGVCVMGCRRIALVQVMFDEFGGGWGYFRALPV